MRSLASVLTGLSVLSLLAQGCVTPDARTDCSSCPKTEQRAVEQRAVEQREQPSPRWFVTRVIDGDTLVARLDEPERASRSETIRLLRINTPEKDQLGFSEAREALKGLVRGGTITLEHENPAEERRGSFGRLLAYVIVDDLNVNVEMVRLGWSRFWTRYGKGRHADLFKAAEDEARGAGRGLWGPGFSP